MSVTSLILVGGGGHCRSVIEVLRTANGFKIAGILDRVERKGQTVSGWPIIGTDELIRDLVQRNMLEFLVTAGQLGPPDLRLKLFEAIGSAGGVLATLVASTAHVADDTQIGPGTWIGHGATVNCGVRIGQNTIVNTGAIIEHDVQIGAHCHVSTGAIINGGSDIGARTMIGSRAVVLQSVSIGSDCVIGAGAVVLHDVPNGQTVVGVPAKPLPR